MATICSCATACARERPLSSWLSTGGGDGVGSDSPMRALPREGEEQVDSGNGHDALDSVRSWLASGAQMVDRRRRFGDHGRTRKLLVVDPSARPNASERWHSTTSALQRHTVGGALSELEPEHRRVITLAYLEGQTNRQIAATLGVSVTTARRRLWAALERLELYVSAAGAWLAGLLVGFSVYVLSRLAKLTEPANTAQRVAATVTVGALAAAAVGVIYVLPSISAPLHASPKAAAPAAPGFQVIFPAANISAPHSVAQPDQQVLGNAVKKADAATGTNHSSNGCHGNLTGAAPTVPVGRHGYHPAGPPVNPLKGGCKNR
ncbi:MAG: RNA polymerase sigma factor [Chloroflexi bacterium]|nr:MAG: RNA polymerase sigma factor [Chloroflexota bacterium]